MDRRKFIEIGAGASASGIVALSSASSIPALAQAGPLDTTPGAPPPDIDAYLSTLDQGLGRLSGAKLVSPRASEPGFEAKNQLARDSLRTLYVAGMLGDLPYESQLDPRVQERLWQMAPEVDHTVAAATNHLENLTSTEWADLQRILRHRSNPAMAISEALTDQAAMNGMSRNRRLQTRAIITNTALRLRSQPPELVVGEYLEKVRKLNESNGMEMMARRNLAARLGEEAFWRENEVVRTRQEGRIPRGLKTMGWGLVIFAGGSLLVSVGTFEGVFVMTAGAVVLIVGLIQLLIDAARR